MSEVKRWRMSDMPLSEYGLYTEVVLASEYEKLDKELETARRVREKLTEQRNRFADCCDRLMPFDEAIQPFDAEIAAIK